ncbi:MAG: hypothetical protein JNN30_03185 [Rhodanobacteraceae bacterium]|nr:hypothetical protein [Rhodanobacteraceae bacterium]
MLQSVRASAVLFALLGGSCAFAQGTIIDGPATFILNGTPFDASPTGNFTGVSVTTQDHLFETGWYFRVAGDTREFFFPVPTTQNYTGNTSTLDWVDVGTRGLFSARQVAVVTNFSGPSGRVEQTMTITNLSQSTPLVINIFHMLDYDVQPTAGNDSATQIGTTRIGLTDPGGATGEYVAIGADAYLVRPFGAADLGAVLDDAVANNFDNSGLPFGPGDFTSGMQWANRTIAPSTSASFVVQFAINTSTVPVTLQSYSVD